MDILIAFPNYQVNLVCEGVMHVARRCFTTHLVAGVSPAVVAGHCRQWVTVQIHHVAGAALWHSRRLRRLR